jgi:hypothetical protein
MRTHATTPGARSGNRVQLTGTLRTSRSLRHRRDSVHKTETETINLARCLDALRLTEETRRRTNLTAGTQHAVSEETASEIKLRTR